MKLKLALPKGHLLRPTEAMLQKAGLELSGYDEQSRSYRPQCHNFPWLFVKTFQEKDIPIQVAVGNYDLGICGLDWIEELLVKYPSSALVKVQNLGYGRGNLIMATNRLTGISSIEGLSTEARTIRIASEYPNLAESFALNLRLRRFKVFPLWGAAEVYPPESAELVLIFWDNLFHPELIPLTSILQSSAFLIANRNSWESKDVSALIKLLHPIGDAESDNELETSAYQSTSELQPPSPALRLALPDGHQQHPTIEFLNRAGIPIGQLESRRASIDNEISVKIIRPQDMPLQVANGNFDLAITGEDWLYDHCYRFPTSPVKELLGLGFGAVRIVAVVSNDLPVDNIQDLSRVLRGGEIPALRIASEYVNIADRYAWSKHLSPYRLIPTWGASEAFLPEDADLLIENIQTGRTIAEHNLKVIDTLFESSACLIGTTNMPADSLKQQRISSFIQTLLQAGATSKGWQKNFNSKGNEEA